MTRGEPSVISIRDTNTLEGLMGARRGPRRGRIALEAPHLPEEERRGWELRLSRAYFACGCSTGAVAALAALVLYAAYHWRAAGSLSAGSVLLGVAVFLGAAGLGKGLGLSWARWSLSRNVAALARRLPAGRQGVP